MIGQSAGGAIPKRCGEEIRASRDEIPTVPDHGSMLAQVLPRRVARIERSEIRDGVALWHDFAPDFASAQSGLRGFVCRNRHSAANAARLSAEDTINVRLPMRSINRPNANGAAACAIRAGAPIRPRR